MRVLRKGIAVALCAAMVITLAPAGSADAAKKPKLNKSKASVEVGKTVKLTVKNGKKKAKVTWKTNKKAIATVAKVKKAKKASANVKGVKEGKAKITATYKLGKTKKKLTCTVTVTAAKPQINVGGTPTAAVNNNVPNPNDIGGVVIPSQGPSDAPKPSATPKPSPTPSNVPKNGSLTSTKLADDTSITIDGKESADEAWVDVYTSQDLMTDRTKESGVRGGETTVTAANAKLMWSDDAFYVLLNVEKAPKDDDSVTIYLAADNKAAKDAIASVNVKDDSSADAKLVKTDKGYCVEAKLALTGKTVGDSVVADIQINEGSTTVNYFDTRSKMEYNEETKQFELKDETVKAGEDASVLGAVELLASQKQPTVAFYTDKEEEMIQKADFKKLPTAAPAEGQDPVDTYPAAHSMTWLDTSYWTDVYTNNGSKPITFQEPNIPDYKGNADRVGLKGNDENSAKAYTIWSENYLYVLYDITDADIAPASADHYDTDSVEFFLDEDFKRNTTYSGDEVQIRVDAINGAFSCKNSNGDDSDASISEGTDPYEKIAYAVQYKHADGSITADSKDATGYMVEMIIKLKSAHKAGDMMGMDLQINDCFTTEITAEDGTVSYGPDRASTLTAYDTTNNGYQDPSCFGRIKLFKKS